MEHIIKNEKQTKNKQPKLFSTTLLKLRNPIIPKKYLLVEIKNDLRTKN